MKTTTIKAAAFAAIMATSGTVAAADLLVTAEQGNAKAGGVSMMAVDLMTDGDARGVQARIILPKGAKVDTRDCLGKLPSGFQGTCEFKQGEIRLMAFAFDGRTLPSGLVELGKIKVSGQLNGQADVVVEDLQVVNAEGKAISSQATVSVGRAGKQPAANNKAR